MYRDEKDAYKLLFKGQDGSNLNITYDFCRSLYTDFR